jgi:hypothetical protein
VVISSGQGVHVSPSMSTRATTLSSFQTPLTIPREASVRAPGRTLQGQQYHLLVQQEQHRWTLEVSETWWLAKDTERGNAVSICEVALPLGGSDLLTFFRVATKAVMLRSSHPQMSALLTVFLEQGHGFFVFAHPTGESLQARIDHRRLMHETEALYSYQQLADALWFFSQQHPPLAHGSIQPAHLVQVGPRWVLTHASPLVAGGVIECVPALATTRLAAQSTPAADLATLSAVIYYAVVGRIPPVEVAEQQAQVMRSGLSPAFAEVLLKGVTHARRSATNLQPNCWRLWANTPLAAMREGVGNAGRARWDSLCRSRRLHGRRTSAPPWSCHTLLWHRPGQHTPRKERTRVSHLKICLPLHLAVIASRHWDG